MACTPQPHPTRRAAIGRTGLLTLFLFATANLAHGQVQPQPSRPSQTTRQALDAPGSSATPIVSDDASSLGYGAGYEARQRNSQSADGNSGSGGDKGKGRPGRSGRNP